MIDIHSHYLPALDDGAKAMEDSLQMLRIAAADGITGVVVTPHMFIDSFKDNTYELIKSRYAAFLEVLKGSSSDGQPGPVKLPEVFLGSENFVNERFILDLEKGKPVLTLNATSYILLEFPLFGVFNHFDRLMAALFSRGLVPVFAHPERNFQFQRDPHVLERLTSQGVYLQLDSMSLTGGFGVAAKTLAYYLLKHNLAHCIGSDAHGAVHRKPLLSNALAVATKMIGEKKAKILVEENPARILHGDEVIALNDVMASKPQTGSWLGALFGKSQ